MSQRSFKDRCVVITGAAGGLGQALVQAFLQAGAKVVALDRDAQALDALQHATFTNTPNHTPSLLTAVCDVTQLPSCEAAMAQAMARFDGIDVLINNAGIAHRSAFAETQLDVLRRVMEVNFFGAVHCTHAAIASLRQRKGIVITISSVAGFAPLVGRTGYAASKHALHGFMDSLRTEVEHEGVDVLLVCPSFIATGIDSAALGANGKALGAGRKTAGGETQASEVAAAILQAARQRKRLLLFSATSKFSWWLSRLWPTRYAAVMKRRLFAEIFPK